MIHACHKMSYLKEVQYPSDRTQQKLLSYHIYNRFKFQTKQNFMHFLRSSAIESWNHPGTRKRKALAPHSNEKMLFGNILSVKIHFVKSQGIYLESGLVSAFNGWTSQKMHEILLCLIFEAVVDVRWKSFLVCWITWMLNFFQIKHFANICSTKLHRIF